MSWLRLLICYGVELKFKFRNCFVAFSLRTFLQSIYHWPSGESSHVQSFEPIFHVTCHWKSLLGSLMVSAHRSTGHGLCFCNLSFSRVIPHFLEDWQSPCSLLLSQITSSLILSPPHHGLSKSVAFMKCALILPAVT